jgi:hypothetical protein
MSAPRNSNELVELAAGEIDDLDIANLQRMAQLYDVLDPVPGGLIDRIQFGITLDALHAEIAELQRSSDLVGVRGEEVAQSQTITFTSAALTAMVTISALSADRVRLDGWIAPGNAVSVELRIGAEVMRTVCDADGRFVFDEVPRGLAQFVLRVPDPDKLPVITPSVEL